VLGILVSQFFDAGIGGGASSPASPRSFCYSYSSSHSASSIIIADAGWRKGAASFDDAWQDARRKAATSYSRRSASPSS